MNAHELQRKGESMFRDERTLRQGEALVHLALRLKDCRRHSQAARRSYVANDRASRIASRILRLRQVEVELDNDLDAYPGSDCGALVAMGLKNAEIGILTFFGTTAEAWNNLLTDRMDSKQANDLGLYILGDDPYGISI